MKKHPTSAEQVLTAMQKYKDGLRPDGMGKTFRWLIAEPKTGHLLPLKAIWAISVGRSCNDFSSGKFIRKKFRKLGFLCIEKNGCKQEEKLISEVSHALKDSSTERQKRLAKAPVKPIEEYRLIVGYKRNPDVVAERLYIAKGRCEICSLDAPFVRKKNNTPYLEVHHIKHLSKGGDDTVRNTRALCPNCHRKAHFG